MLEVVVDVQQSIVDAVQMQCRGFKFTMPVKLSHLGLFMSGGKRKQGADRELSNKFGGDEWKKWRKEVEKLCYVFFRGGIPYPARPGEEALYESFNASSLFEFLWFWNI